MMTKKTNLDKLRDSTLFLGVIVFVIFIFFTILLVDQKLRIIKIEESMGFLDGYEEVCKYETFDTYDLYIPPTEEYCDDKYKINCIDDWDCIDLWYDCIEESEREPEIIYYKKTVCVETMWVKKNE